MQQCTIQFIIHAQTDPKQKILLVGSHETIGNWDPDKGYFLSTSNLNYPQWSSGNITFPKCRVLLIDKKIQFKFVKLRQNNQYLWEFLPGNRKYKPKHSNIILKTFWSQAKGKEVTKKSQIQGTQQQQQIKTNNKIIIKQNIRQQKEQSQFEIDSQDSDEENILNVYSKKQWHSQLNFEDDSSVILQTFKKLSENQDQDIARKKNWAVSNLIVVLANFFPNMQQNNQITYLIKKYLSNSNFLWYAPQQLPSDALINFKKYNKNLPPKTPLGSYFYHHKIVSDLFLEKLKNRKIHQIALFQNENIEKYLNEKGWKVINNGYKVSKQKETQIIILNVAVRENKTIEITDSSKIESRNPVRLKISEICNNFIDSTFKNRLIVIDESFVFQKQKFNLNYQSAIKIEQNQKIQYKRIKSDNDIFDIYYQNQVYTDLNILALYQNISIILVTNDTKQDFLKKTQGRTYNFTVVSTNWFNQGGIKFYQIEYNNNNVSVQNILFKSIILNLFFKKGVIDFLIVISEHEYIFKQIEKLQHQRNEYIKKNYSFSLKYKPQGKSYAFFSIHNLKDIFTLFKKFRFKLQSFK